MTALDNALSGKVPDPYDPSGRMPPPPKGFKNWNQYTAYRELAATMGGHQGGSQKSTNALQALAAKYGITANTAYVPGGSSGAAANTASR